MAPEATTYEVTLRDRTVEFIDGADSYRQEGSMTTFFNRGEGREVVDCWSTRVASFRTSEVLIIRRIPSPDERAPVAAADRRSLRSA
jgi:hypothetical protein